LRKKLIEESVLFVSILKWVVLATAVGAIVGVATAFFIRILSWSTLSVSAHASYFLILPLGLLVSAAIVQYVDPNARGYGTDKVIEAVHRASGKMRARVIPAKLAATIVTASVGGSVGQVGPCSQIGAALASLLADLLRFGDGDRRKLVICGISAGFASVLGAPVAGAVFGLEVLFMGSILYEVLLPSFIAGVTSYHVSSLLGITYLHVPLTALEPLSQAFLLKVVIAGIFFGICAALSIEILQGSRKMAERILRWGPVNGVIGGLVLIGMTVLFSTDYLGLGVELTHRALQGVEIAWYAFLIKIVFTGMTFAFGGSGGIIAPLICAGALAGSFFGGILGLDRVTFAAIGFVSVLAGAANTPIAMSILAIELFGPSIAPYAAISCVISFLMTGHRSVFPAQRIAAAKSSSVDVEIGGEVGDAHSEFKRRDKSLIDTGIKVADRFRRKKD
jgi:H+/Cl- antiporter ClcA